MRIRHFLKLSITILLPGIVNFSCSLSENPQTKPLVLVSPSPSNLLVEPGDNIPELKKLEKTYQVNGIVTDSISGLPLEKVKVKVEELEIQTLADGKFSASITKIGMVKVSCEKDNYESQVEITELKPNLFIQIKLKPINKIEIR